MATEALTAELKQIEVDIRRLEQQKLSIQHKIKELTTRRDAINTKISMVKSDELGKQDWVEKKFPWSDRIQELLKTKFRLESFRTQQLSTINAVLSNQDVLLLMPTGGGKSLCYQLPALVKSGITLVVSPLLSLIEDQISQLQKLGINACTINSTTDKESQKKIHIEVSSGSSTYPIVYVTPEWLAKSKRFMASLQKCHQKNRLNLIAIDEVHCCSQWGHDFRPDYLHLGTLKALFPKIPVLGLTATATMKVLVDVQEILDIQGCLLLKASYNRTNLYYEVRDKPANLAETVELLYLLLSNKYKDQSGIIYTTTVKDTEDITKGLREKGLKVGCYHAYLDGDVRRKAQQRWMDGQYQALVATIAFGMGIDKPDVRFVIHASLPKSMENLFQESGRAGRDGKRADCLLFFRLADVFKVTALNTRKECMQNVYNVVSYSIDTFSCRRAILSKYFEEVWDAKQCAQMCDHCLKPRQHRSVNIMDWAEDIMRLLDIASDSDQRLTCNQLMDAWFRSGGTKKLKGNDVWKPQFEREVGEKILAHLLVRGFVEEDIHFTSYSTISYLKRGKPLPSNGKLEISLTASVAKEAERAPKRVFVANNHQNNKPPPKMSKIIEID